MPKILKVSNRFSLFSKGMSITDGAGDPRYEAEREFHWLSPTWRIRKRGLEVASIRRVVLAWPAAWEVRGDLGAFRVERDLYPSTSGLWVNGGPFDKAEVRGRFLSDNFDISYRGRKLAAARVPFFDWGGRFSVQLAEDDDQAELLVAVVIVTHYMDEHPGGFFGLVVG